MRVVCFFSASGVPSTGLTAKFTMRKVDSPSTPTINDQTMTEMGNGFYSYDIPATVDTALNYIGIFDGSGSLSGAERYVPMRWPVAPNQFFRKI